MAALSFTRRRLLLGSVALVGAAGRPIATRAADGGRLIVATDSEPRNLNPAIVASNGVFFIASKVVEPLAEAAYDAPDGLAPRLAVAWEGSADGLSATFRLRSGVTWHDGKPFTSADVAFSALSIWKPLQNLGRVVFKDLVAVDTPDATTAIFRFSRPTPFQLLRNALPALTSVVPKHLYEGTDILANPANARPVGTGPFVFADYKPGEYYRLTRNPTYWGKDQPKLDEIVFKTLSDRAAAAGALEAGDIHLAAFSAVPLADLDRIGRVPGLKVVTKGYEGLTYQLAIEINHRTPELADRRVRQAISQAIDRDFVVRAIFLGHAAPSWGPVPRHDAQFFTDTVAKYPFDPKAAEALLDEAGFKRGADGVRFSLRLLPAPYFTETRQFGDYLRQALAAVGISAKIVNNDAATHMKAVYTDHAFDLAVAPPVWRGDPAISTTILFQSGLPAGVPFSNQGGYRNPAVDELVAAAAGEIDTEKRTEIYRRLQRLVTVDLPLINVAEWGFTSVASDKVGAIADNPRWAVSNWADTRLDP